MANHYTRQIPDLSEAQEQELQRWVSAKAAPRQHQGSTKAAPRQRRLPCAQAAFQIILHDATGGAVAGARSSGQPVRRAGRVE